MKIKYRGFDIEATRENKEEIVYSVFFQDMEIDFGVDRVSKTVKDTIIDCRVTVDDVWNEPDMYDLEDVLYEGSLKW